MKKIAILFMLVSLSLAVHNCIHDTLDVPLQHIDDVGPKDSIPSDSNNRVLAGTYQSIRIYADYTHLTVGNSVVKEYIQNQLVASAISYYQKTLSVIRITQNITYTDTCGGLSAPKYIRTTGVAADLIILVTAEYSSDSYLAYAMPCALATSNNRPVYGMININYNGLLTATNPNLEENLLTVIHEIAHVLGFSSNLYEYFKTSDGLTPVKTTTVNGKTFPYLKAEPLRTKVRNYFGCANALGAYLENEGDSGSAGSHFERRVFFNDFMTASSITDSVISDFTLALFESTGWYSVLYSDATSQNYEPFAWGKNRGCNFLNGVCMTSSTTTSFPEEFCTPLQRQGCTFTARAVGVCGTASTLYYSPSLPSQFNYYGNNTIVLDSFSDNCPYYLGYPDGDCEDPSSPKLLSAEAYGTSSRCFSGTLTSSASPRSRTGFCFPTACSSSNGATIVTITIGDNAITCTAAGENVVPGYNGVIECPDPSAFCAKANPVYCERGCSGRGTCTNGVCSCPTGWGGSDCGFRVYADGDSRCASESTKKAWFGDACACNPSSGVCNTTELIGIGDGGVNRANDYLGGSNGSSGGSGSGSTGTNGPIVNNGSAGGSGSSGSSGGSSGGSAESTGTAASATALGNAFSVILLTILALA